ncbi:MAG: hypothetical protein ACE15F_15495 [bacterium]
MDTNPIGSLSFNPCRVLLGLSMVFALLAPPAPSAARSRETWTVRTTPEIWRDAAFQAAWADLRETGGDYGLTFGAEPEGNPAPSNILVVGDPQRNPLTRELIEQKKIVLAGVPNPEGFEIATRAEGGGTLILVAGGSVLGDAYGLHWIRDRLRINKSMTAINTKREPALRIRYTRIPVSNEEDIRRALRYGLNWVLVSNVLNFVPWNAEPERGENEKSRARVKELIDYAHALHIQCAAFGTDFTYHPSLLEEFHASLSPADDRFWEAVKEKYRRLLRALPELDGVVTFTGPEQQYWGNYKTFDPMHGGENCDWSLEKRYRTYVRNVWSVVAGEFKKSYMHRTWTTSSYEQQSQPEVYRGIFTDEIPVENLYLIPSFTQNDRWWYQRYNPTVNQTPHNMMVVFETMDYHAGGDLFPVYPGPYFQAGLQLMLDREASNLKGCSLDLPEQDGWDTRTLTAYTVSRLSWDHHDDVERIAGDFASMYFGSPAAPGMARILMQSPAAYKYGLYIEPVAYGEFNSLPHIRVGMFIADGYTRLDQGKVHREFLRQIYLHCKPWIPETLRNLDHGLETAEAMIHDLEGIRPAIGDLSLAERAGNSLQLTRLLIQTNNLYVRTGLAFFQYRENPSLENQSRLRHLCDELENACTAFSNAPGYGYQLFGVTQLMENCRQVLSDLRAAEKRFAAAPDTKTIERSIQEEQWKYERLLEAHAGEAVHLAHFQCKVDGRDLIRIRGGDLEIEHLRWDPMTVAESSIIHPLPAQPVSVIPRSTATRPLHPFILEQPSEENGYTVTLYLDDVEGGGDWWEFDLFYLRQPCRELGLQAAW